MTTFSVFTISMLLVAAVFETALCKECLKLESGDVSTFDTKSSEGKYELVMGIIDTAGDKLKINCNGVELKQHDHPNGGINLAMVYEDTDEERSILDVIQYNFNVSNGIVGVEVGAYDRYFKKWTDKYVKILLSTDDVLAFALCVHDEDNGSTDEFFVNVIRKVGSKTPVSSIREMMPDAIKNNPGLRDLCDH